MRRSIAVALLVVAGASAGAVENTFTGGGYGFCTAMRAPSSMPSGVMRPAETYYTGVFAMNGQDLKPINAAFLQYLSKEYGYKPDPGETQPVVCTALRSLEEANKAQQARMASSKKGHGQAIETRWTPNPQ